LTVDIQDERMTKNLRVPLAIDKIAPGANSATIRI